MRKPWLATLLLMFLIGASEAQSPAPSPTLQSSLVQWLTPAVPSNRKQTGEQEEAGRRVGRTLPEPEILQPTLDASLPSYRPRTEIKLSGTFRGACADTLPALMKLWIAAFTKHYPQVKIEVVPPYDSALGARELARGSLDFTVVSRQSRPEESAAFKNSFGYDQLSVPVSNGSYRHFGFLDSLVFFVSRDNPIEQLSFSQLDAILSRTQNRGGAPATTWGQLGLTGEWADKPIHVYGVKPWDGAEDLVRQRVLSFNGKRGEWRDDVHFDSVFPIARQVAADQYGIGYTGLSYVDVSVKLLALGEDDHGSFYAPTYENLAGALYPLNRYIFFNTNRPPGKPLDPALAEFLRFILSRQGQQLVLDQATFMPLRAEQAKSSRSLLGDR